MNLIFRHRRRLELIPIEQFQLLRALVADTSNVVPGWFWFAEMTPETVSEQLFVLAEQDPSVDVRRRALWLLREAGIPLPNTYGRHCRSGRATIRCDQVRTRYLATIADESVLPFLAKLSADDNPSVASSAREAEFSVLVRLRPGDAFSHMVETGAHASEAKLSLLVKGASAISEPDLLKSAGSQWGQVRQFAVEELARRGRLPKQLFRGADCGSCGLHSRKSHSRNWQSWGKQ